MKSLIIINFYIILKYIKIKISMRKTKSEEDKRKKLSVSVDPEVYELWKKYCDDNGIENYSQYIEMIIKEKLNK